MQHEKDAASAQNSSLRDMIKSPLILSRILELTTTYAKSIRIHYASTYTTDQLPPISAHSGDMRVSQKRILAISACRPAVVLAARSPAFIGPDINTVSQLMARGRI